MMKRFCALVICLLLTGCSLWPWSADEETTTAIPTIGVISALSERITLAQVNSVGWEKSSYQFPLEDWQIDATASSEAERLLRKRGYDVRPVRYDRKAFSANALGGPVARGGLLDRKRPALAPVIRSAVQPNDLDLYLVLVEASVPLGALDPHGVALLRLGGEPTAVALYHAFLIDGHTGETVEDIHAEPLGNGWYQLARVDGPYAEMHKSVWPKPITAWTASQRQDFQAKIEDLLHPSLRKTLDQLDLDRR
ncbi:hypothetical protein ACFPL7_20120 [Dongia soli]|uniref:Uncharacterized protein n=1 Tax=Dongia soli TaxID=600628 RepID=A0ABU5E6K3_9PROT|nr:hypothetical protein [Dongia soli]MDY0881896.1 hypothetical protein [Dongia soli]